MLRQLRASTVLATTILSLALAGCSKDDDDDAAPTGPGSGGGTVLSSGTSVTGLSGAEGSQRRYTITVPEGTSRLRVTLTGGTGDADLYLRFNTPPTVFGYDCSSEGSTNAEECVIDDPQPGTWHVLIDAFEAYSGVTLLAVLTGGGSNVTGLVYRGTFSPAPYRYSRTAANTGAVCQWDITWSNTELIVTFASTAPGAAATVTFRGRRVSTPVQSPVSGPGGSTNCFSRTQNEDRVVTASVTGNEVDATIRYGISDTNIADEVARLTGSRSGASFSGTLTFQHVGESQSVGSGSTTVTLARQ
jgi:hypothetical protein